MIGSTPFRHRNILQTLIRRTAIPRPQLSKVHVAAASVGSRGFSSATSSSPDLALKQANKYDQAQFIQDDEKKDIPIRLFETKEDVLSRHSEHDKWSVHVSDEKRLKDKVKQMQEDGLQNLMMIADFDYTISKHYLPESMVNLRNDRLGLEAHEGPVNTDASMKVMFYCERMTAEQKREDQIFFHKYRPLEMDPSLTKQQKQEHMYQWWTENYKMYSAFGLTEKDFRQMLYSSKLAVRHGIFDLLSQVKDSQIPFIVVSGGVKDVIDVVFYDLMKEFDRDSQPFNLGDYEYLKHQYTLEVLSNTFIFEDRLNEKTGEQERTAVDYDRRLLHSMNKNEFVNDINKEKIAHHKRKNAIVVGDLVEDITMVNATDFDQVLKIGFLNDMKNEHLLDNYLAAYDVVVCRDGPFLPLNMLMDVLGKQTQYNLLTKYQEFDQLQELYKVLTSK